MTEKERIERMYDGVFNLALHYGVIVRDDILHSDIAEEDKETLKLLLEDLTSRRKEQE